MWAPVFHRLYLKSVITWVDLLCGAYMEILEDWNCLVTSQETEEREGKGLWKARLGVLKGRAVSKEGILDGTSSLGLEQRNEMESSLT